MRLTKAGAAAVRMRDEMIRALTARAKKAETGLQAALKREKAKDEKIRAKDEKIRAKDEKIKKLNGDKRKLAASSRSANLRAKKAEQREARAKSALARQKEPAAKMKKENADLRRRLSAYEGPSVPPSKTRQKRNRDKKGEEEGEGGGGGGAADNGRKVAPLDGRAGACPPRTPRSAAGARPGRAPLTPRARPGGSPWPVQPGAGTEGGAAAGSLNAHNRTGAKRRAGSAAARRAHHRRTDLIGTSISRTSFFHSACALAMLSLRRVGLIERTLSSRSPFDMRAPFAIVDGCRNL